MLVLAGPCATTNFCAGPAMSASATTDAILMWALTNKKVFFSARTAGGSMLSVLMLFRGMRTTKVPEWETERPKLLHPSGRVASSRLHVDWRDIGLVTMFATHLRQHCQNGGGDHVRPAAGDPVIAAGYSLPGPTAGASGKFLLHRHPLIHQRCVARILRQECKTGRNEACGAVMVQDYEREVGRKRRRIVQLLRAPGKAARHRAQSVHGFGAIEEGYCQARLGQ